MKTTVNENSEIYYKGQYWNNFPQVLEYMSENFTGDRKKWWVKDFKERYALTPFKRGLFLNCGNGWVEREFIDEHIVMWAAAFDYSARLISIAQKEKGPRAISYFRADANRIDFADNQFDLVVNVAALHHVQYINRFCCILCKTTTEDGVFVNFDYIGPARNQYSKQHWRCIKQVNRSLPKNIRKSPLIKPYLPSMLNGDPTEAIHSDLIIPTIRRFFDIVERHDTGGGIAYEILTHNSKLNILPMQRVFPHIEKILEIDRKFTHELKEPPLFSYFIAQPNKSRISNNDKLESFQSDEDEREFCASKMGGVYSTSDLLRLLIYRTVLWVLNAFRITEMIRGGKRGRFQ